MYENIVYSRCIHFHSTCSLASTIVCQWPIIEKSNVSRTAFECIKVLFADWISLGHQLIVMTIFLQLCRFIHHLSVQLYYVLMLVLIHQNNYIITTKKASANSTISCIYDTKLTFYRTTEWLQSLKIFKIYLLFSGSPSHQLWQKSPQLRLL